MNRIDVLTLGRVSVDHRQWAERKGPARSTDARVALRRRSRRPYTVLDRDYRPMLWREDAAPWYREAGELATVIVGNAAEWRVLGAPPAAVELVVEKLGRDGARGFRERRSAVVSPISVEVEALLCAA